MPWLVVREESNDNQTLWTNQEWRSDISFLVGFRPITRLDLRHSSAPGILDDKRALSVK